MFRFTIRDLLWLMVVVALGVGWCLDRSKRSVEIALIGQRCSEIQQGNLRKIIELQEANQRLELRERDRETQEMLRKIKAGEIPWPD